MAKVHCLWQGELKSEKWALTWMENLEQIKEKNGGVHINK
jgi:hypothetical protein